MLRLQCPDQLFVCAGLERDNRDKLKVNLNEGILIFLCVCFAIYKGMRTDTKVVVFWGLHEHKCGFGVFSSISFCKLQASFRVAALHRSHPRRSASALSVMFTKANIRCSQPKDVTVVMYVAPADSSASWYLSFSRLTAELQLRAVKFRPVKIFTADHRQTWGCCSFLKFHPKRLRFYANCFVFFSFSVSIRALQGTGVILTESSGSLDSNAERFLCDLYTQTARC